MDAEFEFGETPPINRDALNDAAAAIKRERPDEVAAVVVGAMIVRKDGNIELTATHGDWAALATLASHIFEVAARLKRDAGGYAEQPAGIA